ncbi:hypothetical protein [Spirosoma spitsbergense]|uniref:hypothetical protein n=1 Tax=Spirosoma spitsbergense TaxID=431554 RepID=UPI0012FC836C|nr:hypothetical protein [Spirosoma spitsbergense]
MRWSNVLLLSASIAKTGLLMALAGLLSQCKVVPDDVIPPTLTLSKGTKMGDPIVQTAPTPVTLITVGNKSDNLLASRYLTQNRPANVNTYVEFRLAVDTIPAQKLLGYEFSWKPTDSKTVMVAIFQNVVQVDTKTNEIANVQDLVWLWTNPDGTTDPGKARYSDGRGVTNWDKVTGEYSFGPPVALTAGKQPNYIWCVLAWDKQGYAIRYASRELPLFIQ